MVVGQLEPVEAELAAVHWIHDLADNGLTLRDIAGELITAGYHTKWGAPGHVGQFLNNKATMAMMRIDYDEQVDHEEFSERSRTPNFLGQHKKL